MEHVLCQLRINGREHSLSIPPQTRLIDVLREHLSLTGTHRACDTAQCGACTVLVDGLAVKSCNRLALQEQNRDVTTIEGISNPRSPAALHRVQQLLSQHHGLQCGYCTPGFVMRILAMVHESVPAEPEAIKQALGGNLCRCTGYAGIVKATEIALVELRHAL